MYLHLNILIDLIINDYFNSSNCLLLFKDNYSEYQYQGNIPIVLLNIQDEIPEEFIFRNYGCQGIIIAGGNSRRVFERFEALIKLKMERFNYRRYLILHERTSKGFEIFNSASIRFVVDILVVSELLLRDTFGLYTHQYVGKGNDSKNIIEVDRWFSKNQSFLWNRNLYPDKLMNQMGRDLKIATFTYQPYSIPNNLDGTEILVVLEFTKRYNLTPIFLIDEAGMWGEVFDNWTGNGIVGNLVMDKADTGLGALYTWEQEYYFLDLSKPTIRTGITCIAPAPKTVGGWITPFISFSWKMWLMMLVSFLVACLAIFLVLTLDALNDSDKLENLTTSFMSTQAIFLLQSLSKISSNSNARIIFALILILSLMTATLYSSGLASNMTVPRYSGMIDDVWDLVRSEVHWGANSIAWTSSLLADNSMIYKKAVSSFYAGTTKEMIEKNNETFAFSIERLHGGYYALGDYITKEGVQNRRLMSKDIYWDFCVLMLRKNSVLLPKWDEILLEISQTGLPYFWEYQVNVRNADIKLQEAVRYSSHLTRPDTTKLTLVHLEGAFALWLVGLCVSLGFFLFEIRSGK